jgi:hypothetical protein
MKRLFLCLVLCIFSDAQAVEFGPFCQWYKDPCRSMAIQWVADKDVAGKRWIVSPGGFGYGHDVRTKLDDMRGNYRSIYLRHAFSIPDDLPGEAEVVLAIRHHDGFIAYLDGTEVARSGVQGVDSRLEQVQTKKPGQWEYFPLGPAVAGHQGLIAIAGHNDSLQSPDYSMNAHLELRIGERTTTLVPEGAQWACLKGGGPDRFWNKLPPLAEIVAGSSRFQLAYRVASGGKWASSLITRRRFGDTLNEVFTADLKGLSPGTRYAFKIFRYGRLLGTWYFETAPARFVDGLSFVTGGDMFHSRDLLDAMNRRAGTEDPLFALLGGDLAYANGVDGNRWLEWIESWTRCAISPSGRLLPMIVVIGNHEVRGAQYRPSHAPPRSEAPYFYSLFLGLAAGSRFSVDFGNYMSVIALDSGHTANVVAQRRWLEEALDSRKDFPRQFICYHRPAWGTGVKGDALDIQRSWSPLFEEYLVDAVFENDHHVYKRTHPLKGGRRDDEDGVVYLGDGAWGTRTRSIPSGWKRSRPFLARAESVNHLIKVIMHPKEFRYQAITANGEVIDDSRRPMRR